LTHQLCRGCTGVSSLKASHLDLRAYLHEHPDSPVCLADEAALVLQYGQRPDFADLLILG